ncbi:MAG: tetratricopeptide repeat protein [Desulfotalea sp.]
MSFKHKINYSALAIFFCAISLIATSSTYAKQDTSATKNNSTLDELIDSSEKLLESETIQKNTPVIGQTTVPNESITKAFSGYDKEKISVDFYKIDLHNVFRLLREISGQNIIVDESVNGTLTLAMSDVPWDFVLDVVLNLKDLGKEEKFNTIVIYPKGKGFEWPDRSGGDLTITPIASIIANDELIIEQSAQQPEERLLAKEFIAKARKDEKRGNIELAIGKYTKACNLWPENSQIATRISTLYLVDLGMNAKALHYAQKALKNNSKDDKAALYAAISSANMGRTKEASEYFRQSVSNAKPSKEAIISFASFAENNDNNKGALSLLKKLHKMYGESINSMVSMARVYDKEGQYNKANQQYQAILSSGFQLNPSLRSYINERLSSKIQ